MTESEVNIIQGSAITAIDQDARAVGLPAYSELYDVLFNIWMHGHPDHSFSGTEAEFGQKLVQLAGRAIGQAD